MTEHVSEQTPAPPAGPSAAELKITGIETTTNTVPADVLVCALGGFQQIVYLIGAYEEGKSIERRFTPTEKLKERYTIRCGIPERGSYGLPLTVNARGTLFPDAAAATLFTCALDLFRSAAHGSFEELVKLLPDPKFVNRILAELQAFLPRPGDRWAVEYSVGTERVAMDAKTYRSVRRLVAPERGEDAEMTVTGELIRVDFAQYQLVLLYSPTMREIQCACTPEILETVIQNRRQPIQVTGRFLLDAEGNPDRLTDVTLIEPVDLSPMTFDRIERGERLFTIEPPLTLEPTLDEESGQLYVLHDDELDIHVFAQTREQVVDELAEQLVFLWDSYARESLGRLTPRAQQLREKLRGRMQEISLATQPEGR